MASKEYVVLRLRITENEYGGTDTDITILEKSKISEKFKDKVYDDYTINLDDVGEI